MSDGMTEMIKEESALARQEGGDHYKKLKIQPMEYSMANNLDACQHTIIKYVTRFRDKNGIEDLKKARHTIDMLIEFESRGEGAPPVVEQPKDEGWIEWKGGDRPVPGEQKVEVEYRSGVRVTELAKSLGWYSMLDSLSSIVAYRVVK